MSNHWYDQQKTYRARRRKRVNPFFPENRIVFAERDERHAQPGNPFGHLVVAEGRTFRAYPTPGVKRLIGTSIDEVEPGAGAKSGFAPSPDAITSIIDDEGLVGVLERHGIDTVPELVEQWVTGRLDSVRGIGETRKARIRSALLAAGLIRVDDAELDRERE